MDVTKQSFSKSTFFIKRDISKELFIGFYSILLNQFINYCVFDRDKDEVCLLFNEHSIQNNKQRLSLIN